VDHQGQKVPKSLVRQAGVKSANGRVSLCLLETSIPKLESTRSNWRGEKPKPTYTSWSTRRRRFPFPPLQHVIVILAVLVVVAVSLLIYFFGIRGRGFQEYNLEKARQEYYDYLASPQHQALIYPTEDDRAHGKGALIALVRNSELREMAQSMRELEETFNRKFKVPWIFFNDEPFEDKFIRITSSLTDAETSYGIVSILISLKVAEVIPREHWNVPTWIHPDMMQASFDKLDSQRVQYAKMLSYHKMCRWNSGLFYQHPALANYTWYWRVEPNVQCVSF